MKTYGKPIHQQGFFDLGIALLVLAFSGGMVYSTNVIEQPAPQQVAESESALLVVNKNEQ